MKCVVLDISNVARTYDDSGWGHKSFCEYNIKLYSDLSVILEIKGSTIMSDSMNFFQTDNLTLITGNYLAATMNNIPIIKQTDKETVYEYTFLINNIDFETATKNNPIDENPDVVREKRSTSNFNFQICNSNNDINILFDTNAKSDIFSEYYINNNWFFYTDD